MHVTLVLLLLLLLDVTTQHVHVLLLHAYYMLLLCTWLPPPVCLAAPQFSLAASLNPLGAQAFYVQMCTSQTSLCLPKQKHSGQTPLQILCLVLVLHLTAQLLCRYLFCVLLIFVKLSPSAASNCTTSVQVTQLFQLRGCHNAEFTSAHRVDTEQILRGGLHQGGGRLQGPALLRQQVFRRGGC